MIESPRQRVHRLARGLILAFETPSKITWVDASRHARFLKAEFLPGEYEHSHAYHELVYAAQGALILTMNGKAARLDQGTLAVFPPGVRHHERPLKSGKPYQALGILVENTGGLWVSFREPGANYPHYRTTPTYRFPVSLDDFKADWRGLFSTDRIERAYLRNRLQNFLIVLWRRLGQAGELAAGKQEPLFLPRKAMSRAEGFIREHFQNEISLSDVAAYVGYSTDHFSRVFRKLHGKSPLALIQDLRLEKARDQLLHSDVRLAELARLAGFNHVSYFIAVFKKRYGVTPSVFRQRSVR